MKKDDVGLAVKRGAGSTLGLPAGGLPCDSIRKCFGGVSSESCWDGVLDADGGNISGHT